MHSTEQPARPLEIAHVLFMDIVSYGRLPIERKPEVISELQDIVRSMPEFQQNKLGDQVICLPTGDGIAMAFFGDLTLPVRCAQRIALALKDKNSEFGLRMGIHTGPVYRVSDINENRNVAGGGIDLAERVMSCGGAGHILVSKAAAEYLLQLKAWKSALHDVGEFEVKHGDVIRIFSLFTEDFGNSQPPSKTKTGRGPLSVEPAPNPFNPWEPVVPPAFVGRARQFARLQDALDEGRSISLVGDVRIGKSSLLRTYLVRLERSGRIARLLNGSGREGASPGVFVECATGVRTSDVPDVAADVLSNWARQAHRPGLWPTLLVDEFDGLLPRFDHRFFERLRGMLPYLCIVVSSRRELDRLYQDLGKTSPFYNTLELCWLGLLESDAADQLISRYGKELPGGADAMIREWAGRHPFFIQLLGRKLIDSCRFGESSDDAIEQFLTESGGRLRVLWGTLLENDRQSLRAAVDAPQPSANALRRRGLLTEQGRPFGRVLVEWLKEENR